MLWWCCAAPRAEPPEARSERDNLFSKPREESEAAPLAAEQAADDAESTTAAMSTEDAIRGPKKPALRFEQHEALVELRSLAQPEPFGQVWTVHEELGRGAFAIVRRATRNGLVRRGSFRAKHDGACSAAVKCFGPSSTLGAGASAELSPSLAADLALEVSILRSLTCPEHGDERCDAVVHMLGFYVSENGERGELSCQLVMDLVGGGELFDRLLLRSHYTEANARALFARVLDAMRFCHENLIVHRDLKPENLLLKSRDDDEDVAVGDFGGAARLARPGALIEDSVVGTPGFMAPEMIKGEPHGEPVDLWACGCILFILLVGEAPFTGNGSKTRRAKYAFAPALKWASISDDAKDLVTKLLVAEPAKRLTARAALRHPWFLLNADHSLLARNLDHTIGASRSSFLARCVGARR